MKEENENNVNGVAVFTEKLVDLLRVSLVGTLNDVKIAKKEFKKNADGMRRGFEYTAEQRKMVMDAFEKYKTVDTKHKILFIGVLKDIIWYFRRKESRFLCDFIIDNIVHPDGGVRQALVNFVDWWRIDDDISFRDDAKIGDTFHYFLLEIKKLILLHQPKDIVISDDRMDFPTYINDLKPSVYKSLVLVWEKVTMGEYIEKKLKKYPELQLGVPKRNWDDDDWLEENEVYADEEALNLWAGQKIDAGVYSAFSVLESLARSRFIRELEELGFEKKFYEKLIREMEKHQAMEGEDVESYDILIQESFRLGIPHEYTDPLIRGFLAFSNHRNIQNEKGEPMSPLLLSAVMERESQMRHEPKDIKAFLFRIRDAHLAIDAFCERLIKNNRAFFQEVLERMDKNLSDKEKTKGLKEEFERHQKRYVSEFYQCASIAHHVFDWYVLSAPWGVLRKTPEKLAGLSYFVVKKANEERKSYHAVGYANRDISEFGKWAGNAISGSAGVFFNDVMNGVRDPELLYIKKRMSKKRN